MITISKADFYNKDKSFKCWFWFLKFSRETGRCTTKKIPTEVNFKIGDKIYSVSSENNPYITIYISDLKKGSRIMNIGSSTTINGGVVEINNSHLCETQEEAVELYNVTILNEKDKLTSLYEKRINYLDKNLLEDGRN